MKRLLFIFILALSFSCGKENLDPVFNNYPLIGTWIGRNGSPVFNINNLTNEGNEEKYLEYREGSERLLRRTYNGIPVTYRIYFISDIDLKLVDRLNGASLELLRIK